MKIKESNFVEALSHRNERALEDIADFLWSLHSELTSLNIRIP